jgi:hypothetical protein
LGHLAAPTRGSQRSVFEQEEQAIMVELINFVGALLALIATFFRRSVADGPQIGSPP